MFDDKGRLHKLKATASSSPKLRDHSRALQSAKRLLLIITVSMGLLVSPRPVKTLFWHFDGSKFDAKASAAVARVCARVKTGEAVFKVALAKRGVQVACEINGSLMEIWKMCGGGLAYFSGAKHRRKPGSQSRGRAAHHA
jgi:hypothetical protein